MGRRKTAALALVFSLFSLTAAYAADEKGAAEQPRFVTYQETAENAEALYGEYIPVLMYHHFADRPMAAGNGVVTTTMELEDQLRYFQAEGWRVISLEELDKVLEQAARKKKSLRDESFGLHLNMKYLCITMDDGYYSNYELAYPLFEKYRVTASVFAVTDFITEQTGIRKFTWKQAVEMEESGVVKVYSHSADHIPVEEGQEEAFLACMRKSQETLAGKPEGGAYQGHGVSKWALYGPFPGPFDGGWLPDAVYHGGRRADGGNVQGGHAPHYGGIRHDRAGCDTKNRTGCGEAFRRSGKRRERNMRKMIIAGNWKMNKTPKEAAEFCRLMKDKAASDGAEVVFCVPFVDLYPVLEELKGTGIGVGAENMHFEDSGAYTGEVSAPMLKEMGVGYVVLGHSERRQYFGETDEMVNKKVKKALEAGIVPIMCCGETLEQREAGITIEWVRIQIKCGLAGVSAEDVKKVVIAYEPIWAIGTGKTATSAQAQEVCHAIREVLAELYGKETAEEVRIQYGGSVNAKNAAELFGMEDIDGGLVGGASLKEEFTSIVHYK